MDTSVVFVECEDVCGPEVDVRLCFPEVRGGGAEDNGPAAGATLPDPDGAADAVAVPAAVASGAAFWVGFGSDTVL